MDLTHALTILIEGKDELAPAIESATKRMEEFNSKVWLQSDKKGQEAANAEIKKMDANLKKLEDTASKMWENPAKAAKAFEGKITDTVSLLVWAFNNTFLVKVGGAVLKFIKFLSEIPKKLIQIAKQATLTGVALTAAFLTASMAAAKFSEQGEFARDVFESIAGDSAPELLQSLRETSRFMITDTKLLETYNKAYMLVGDTIARRMPEAYDSLSRVATAYGEDADYLMDRLYRSVGRLSTRWMAYIGTVVTVEEAEAAAAIMFGKTADALTYGEKQAGMMDLALKKLAERAQDFPELLGTTVQMSAALKVSVTNLAQAYGEIFTPALRSGTQAGLEWLRVLQSLISEGGGLYNFLRTVSATMSVIFDYIAQAAQKFFDFEEDINNSIDALGDSLIRKAWEAFSWGFNISAEIGIGLMQGAVVFISAAASFITRLLTFWFKPSSPPRVAPNIDKWGALTMNEFLKGFESADFDILEGTQSKLETVLQAMVSAGWMVKQEAAKIFLGISADMVEALSKLEDTGEVVGQMFSGLLQLEGPYGEALVKLTLLQIGYSDAVNMVEQATLRLTAAEEELVASQDNLTKETDEYYLLLLNKASYTDLIAGRAEKQAAKKRSDFAKTDLKNAEKEKDAAEENLEGLEDRLQLQGKLIDQLSLLLQKQAEMLPDEAKSAAEKDLAGPGGAFELPEFNLAGAIPTIEIDQAFEDLKDRIKAKFQTLWDDVLAYWESSGASKRWGLMLRRLKLLDEWLSVTAPVYVYEWKQKMREGFYGFADMILIWWDNNVSKTLAKFTDWLTVGAPVAVFEFKQAFTEQFLEISTFVVEWWNENVFPVLELLTQWLTISAPVYLYEFHQAVYNKFTDVSTFIVTWWNQNVFPILTKLTRWLTVSMPVYLFEFKQAFVTKFDAIALYVTDWWEETIEPLFKDIVEWWEVTLPEKLENLVQMFQMKFPHITDNIEKAWTAVKNLLGALKELLKWILANPMGLGIGLNLPEPLENESPLKIHTRLMDMDRWIKENPMYVNMDLSETSRMGGSGSAMDTGTSVYIETLILEGVEDAPGLLRQLQEAI